MIMVFKPGTQAIVRGVSVDFERILPQSLDAYLANGWFKTTEECKHARLSQQVQEESQNAEPKPAPENEVDIYSLGILELREHARHIGLKPGNTRKAELQKMVADYERPAQS